MHYSLENTSPQFLTFCLAFADTADWHASSHPVEEITSIDVLIDWEEMKGIISSTQASRLRADAERDPAGAEDARRAAIDFREVVYRVFAAIAGKLTPDPHDLERINAILQQGLSRASLIGSQGDYHWMWVDNDNDYECLLWPAAHSAARLLTDKKLLARVRQCADEHGCGVLFLDRTRNHSRRWCSMKSCGNRAKVARHYQRQRKSTDN